VTSGWITLDGGHKKTLTGVDQGLGIKVEFITLSSGQLYFYK